MKRRVAPILTFTIALILVSGLAYAAKKKVNTRPAVRTPDPTHEEEALAAELLEATEEHKKKMPSIGDINKNTDEVVKAQIIAKQPKE
jgi:hypothetical protein